jgi:hypothetical protein
MAIAICAILVVIVVLPGQSSVQRVVGGLFAFGIAFASLMSASTSITVDTSAVLVRRLGKRHSFSTRNLHVTSAPLVVGLGRPGTVLTLRSTKDPKYTVIVPLNLFPRHVIRDLELALGAVRP